MIGIMVALTIVTIFIVLVMIGTEDNEERKVFLVAYVISLVAIVMLFIMNLAVMLWK